MCAGELPWKAALTSFTFLQPRPSGGADVANDKEKNNNGSNGSFTNIPLWDIHRAFPSKRAVWGGSSREAHILRSNQTSRHFCGVVIKSSSCNRLENRFTGKRGVKRGREQETKMIYNARSKASKTKTKPV